MKLSGKYISPFVESLCIQDGQVHNLSFHNERMNRTRREVFGIKEPLDLAAVLQPSGYDEKTKCRVLYTEDIQTVEYQTYKMRTITSLKLVSGDDVDYRYKSTNREKLNDLFEKRSFCDDILIVKNGLLTDASTANVALWNGQEWETPAQPLLEGTQRASLLAYGTIIPKDILVDNLLCYQSLSLFNAMIPFKEIVIPIEKILE